MTTNILSESNDGYRRIWVNIDGNREHIDVPRQYFDCFKAQFCRENPTPLQVARYRTVINLLRCALKRNRG